MNSRETSLLTSGQDVGLAVADFTAEIADFGALDAANTDRAELVTAIVAKQAQQGAQTTSTTTAKDTAREELAVTTDTLSARAVGYALATKRLDLKQAFTLPYSDVRYGDATEDVNHVRDFVAKVQALPAQVRKEYRLTDAVIQAPLDAAKKFEEAEDAQTTTKTAPRLATLDLPALLRQLSAALLLMKALIYGQRLDKEKGFDWAGLNTAFANANKRRKTAAKTHPNTTGPRIVRTLHLHGVDGRAFRVEKGKINYGPAYTLTVENHAATDLLVWAAQKDGAKTTPVRCPAGAVTVLLRADLGPETAQYLMGQYAGSDGGEAVAVVRRVVG